MFSFFLGGQFIWLQQGLFNSLLQWVNFSVQVPPNCITLGSFTSIHLQSYLSRNQQATLMVQRTLWCCQVSRRTLVARTWLSQWSHELHSSAHVFWVETSSDHAVESWMMEVDFGGTSGKVDLLAFGNRLVRAHWGELWLVIYFTFLSVQFRNRTAPHAVYCTIYDHFSRLCMFLSEVRHSQSMSGTHIHCMLPMPLPMPCGHMERRTWDLWLCILLQGSLNFPSNNANVW